MTILEQIEDTIFNLHYWEHYRKMAQIRHCKKFVEVADKNIAKIKIELNKLKERQEEYGGNQQQEHGNINNPNKRNSNRGTY